MSLRNITSLEVSETEMQELIAYDLCNELTHLHHYVVQAASVSGMERAYLQNLYEEEAKSEMRHVREFSDKLVAAGGISLLGIVKPQTSTPLLRGICGIKQSIKLESEVCGNYALRINQADYLHQTTSNPFWKSLALFYEEQLEHSQKDLDNFKQFLVEKI